MTDPATPPRAARATDGDTVVKVSGSVNLRWPHILAILSVLGAGGGVLYNKANKADDKAGEAKVEAAQGKRQAKADVAELGRDVKEKLDPTAGVAVQAATVAAKSASECATKAEVEELRRVIEGLPLSGRRRWRGRGGREREVRIEVPPEVKAPLPVPPAPAEAKP
jgi:hypothetical protein